MRRTFPVLTRLAVVPVGGPWPRSLTRFDARFAGRATSRTSCSGGNLLTDFVPGAFQSLDKLDARSKKLGKWTGSAGLLTSLLTPGLDMEPKLGESHTTACGCAF